MCYKLKHGINIHMFEPYNNSYLTLCEKFDNINNFKINNLALSNIRGKCEINICSSNPGLNSLYLRNDIHNKKLIHNVQEIIRVETLDQYTIKENVNSIDFLKIDVEGNEFNVLLGANLLLKNRAIKYIQFEYGGTYLDAGFFLKDIYKYLTKYNYNVYKILPHKILLIDNYRTELENFQLQNFIASRDYIDL